MNTRRIILIAGIALGGSVALAATGTFVWPLFSRVLRSELMLADSPAPNAQPAPAQNAEKTQESQDSLFPTPQSHAADFVVKLKPTVAASLLPYVPRAAGVPLMTNPKRLTNATSPLTIIDPLTLAKTMRPSDPDLITWLQHWHQLLASNQPLASDDREKLAAILQKTPLICLPLFSIAQTFEKTSDDAATTAILYAAAVRLAHNELPQDSIGSEESRRILLAMHPAKILLWRVIDAGDRSYMQTMYVLNSDLVAYIPPDDPALRDALVHGKVGVAECLIAFGKPNEALQAASAINTEGLTQQERASVAWVRGPLLFYSNRFQEAIPELELTAHLDGFKYQQSARPMLVLSLIQEKRLDDAEREYKSLERADPQNVLLAQCKYTLIAAYNKQRGLTSTE